eukprot:12879815-Alexandrium_andersonii.AAC.1
MELPIGTCSDCVLCGGSEVGPPQAVRLPRWVFGGTHGSEQLPAHRMLQPSIVGSCRKLCSALVAVACIS